jgi:pimeloyl-ACP methyl ester carboxylesterase
MVNDLTKLMTLTQATFIAANFEVIGAENNSDIPLYGSGFDATVWRGKAGSDYAGQVFVSMRGTEPSPGADLVADGSLATRGIPYEQIRDMANWWLRATAKQGDEVKQIKVDSFVTPSLTSYTFAAGTAVKATGELYGQVGNITAVNGHSLGGYLATAFTRLFRVQANVTQTSTFNSAGFLAGSDKAVNDAAWRCAA